MYNKQVFDRPYRPQSMDGKGTPTLGQELRRVFRFVFDQPEERLKTPGFVWSYEELADHIPD